MARSSSEASWANSVKERSSLERWSKVLPCSHEGYKKSRAGFREPPPSALLTVKTRIRDTRLSANDCHSHARQFLREAHRDNARNERLRLRRSPIAHPAHTPNTQEKDQRSFRTRTPTAPCIAESSMYLHALTPKRTRRRGDARPFREHPMIRSATSSRARAQLAFAGLAMLAAGTEALADVVCWMGGQNGWIKNRLGNAEFMHGARWLNPVPADGAERADFAGVEGSSESPSLIGIPLLTRGSRAIGAGGSSSRQLRDAAVTVWTGAFLPSVAEIGVCGHVDAASPIAVLDTVEDAQLVWRTRGVGHPPELDGDTAVSRGC